MPTRKQAAVVAFTGGWATDFGDHWAGGVSEGAFEIPFLFTATNIQYNLDGSPRKIGGATKLNSTAITEAATAKTVHGFTDYFRYSSGSPTQKRVAYAGTRLLKEDLDGTWDELGTGYEDNKVPCFETFNNSLIIATTSNTDVPLTWDQTTLADLGGSPPNFAFMVRHKNRLWAAGVSTNPSRLYYCSSLNEAEWNGTGTSGSIDVDPDDGDAIVGLASHKNDLWVFKGPQRGSVHRITGSTPSDFARTTFVQGIGGINQGSIVRIREDLVWASHRGIHSLKATAAYGDFNEAFLSEPITKYYQDSLNHSAFGGVWGVNYAARGYALWTFPATGGTTMNKYLLMDYRFDPPRWALWENYLNAHSLAMLQTSTGLSVPFVGTTDGFVYQLDNANRSIASATAYTATVATPLLNFGSMAYEKTLEDGWVILAPHGNYNFTLTTQQDLNADASQTLSQATGGDTLG